MNPTIRTVCENDAPAIVRVLNPIIAAGNLTAIAEPIGIDSQIEFIRALPERAIYLAAIQDDRLVAVQDLLPSADDIATGEISTFVAMDAHGVGIGRALATATIAAARQIGYRRLVATIRADNPGALAFYRRMGFRVVASATDKVVTELQLS